MLPQRPPNDPMSLYPFLPITTLSPTRPLLGHIRVAPTLNTWGPFSSPELAGDLSLPHRASTFSCWPSLILGLPNRTSHLSNCVVVKGIGTCFHSALICHGCNTKCSTIVSDEVGQCPMDTCFSNQLTMTLEFCCQFIHLTACKKLTYSLVGVFFGCIVEDSFEMWVVRAD